MFYVTFAGCLWQAFYGNGKRRFVLVRILGVYICIYVDFIDRGLHYMILLNVFKNRKGNQEKHISKNF